MIEFTPESDDISQIAVGKTSVIVCGQVGTLVDANCPEIH